MTPAQTSQTYISAFSAYASPDEDWTKVSDFEERRRIQSRIAQRNFRMKGRQRLDTRSGPPVLERAYHEPLTPSPSPETHSDLQELDFYNYHDVSGPETMYQQYSPLSEHYDVSMQPLTSQSLESIPYAHVPEVALPPHHLPSGGQQPENNLFYSTYPPNVPQQQYPHVNHGYSMSPQQYTAQHPLQQSTCAHTVAPEHITCHSHSGIQQYQMHGFYDRRPLPTDWPGPGDYNHGSMDSFEQVCGRPAVYSGSLHDFPWQSASPCMALSTPGKRGCCCQHQNHNHAYHPRGTHSFQNTTQGRMLLSHQ